MVEPERGEDTMNTGRSKRASLRLAAGTATAAGLGTISEGDISIPGPAAAARPPTPILPTCATIAWANTSSFFSVALLARRSTSAMNASSAWR
jgi:hypothetical protein